MSDIVSPSAGLVIVTTGGVFPPPPLSTVTVTVSVCPFAEASIV